MWLLCDCQGQNTTELLNFCRDNLPEDIWTGICMPTYDSMKKYQGSWHIEEKTVFPEYFLIKESQRETLRNAFAQWPYTEAFCSSIAETSTQLLPEQEKLLQSFLGKENHMKMSAGYIKDGTAFITQGPLQGKEKMIRKIDRHKRLARLEIPIGDKFREICAGLEITSKS